MARYVTTLCSVPSTMRRLERELGALMDRWSGEGGWDWELTDTFSPKLNVAETENDYEVSVDLPGMKPEEFDVEFRDGQLWINGERKDEKKETGKAYRRVERHYGRFQRVVPLAPAVEESKISAEYKDGVLKIVVPKAEAAKPKRITVKG